MQDVLILKNAVIFDGVNEEPLRGKSLVIADGKIDAICDGEAVCTGDVRIIDLDGAFPLYAASAARTGFQGVQYVSA